MHTTERAPSTRLHASIAAALLLAATSAARADPPVTLSLNSQSFGNSQLPDRADPVQWIPSLTGTTYSGTLTGVKITATACYWSGAGTENPSADACNNSYWPKAGDLAIIIYQPSQTVGMADTIVLQVGGAAPISNGSFPFVAGSSTHGEPGNCGSTNTSGALLLGCAGATGKSRGSESPCAIDIPTTPIEVPNGGGSTNYTNHQYLAGDGGWTGGPLAMQSTWKVKTAWIPADTNLLQNHTAKFCNIDIEFTGVTAGISPPCANPTYIGQQNCGNPCLCSNSSSGCSSSPGTANVHPVEIRFENRSGFPPEKVMLLPISCSSSFATTSNPGVLYKSQDCSEANLLWRDGLFSAYGPTFKVFNGCGHVLPEWDGQDGCVSQVFPTSDPVPMRTMSLSQLTPTPFAVNTYSVWTNHFPDAIWYIGLPQKTATGWTTVPEVPFYVKLPWQQQFDSDYTIEVNGLSCRAVNYDPQAQMIYLAPSSPAPGDGAAAWPLNAKGDCEAAGVNGACTIPYNGVDFQQFEITLDGSPADIADITYIDFANVPLRLESYSSNTPLQATGFAAVPDASVQVHPSFRQLVGHMKYHFPANLYMSCEGGSPGTTVLQAAGPSQNDKTCNNSQFVPSTYPAYGATLPAVCSRQVSDFRAVFDRAFDRQSLNYQFHNHKGVPGCAWIRDWLGVPNFNTQFDYDFVLSMTKDTSTLGQTSYTATLKGTVALQNPDSTTGPFYQSDPLTIILGTDTYFTDQNKAPILDLTRAIYLATTPGNLPKTLQVPSGCSPAGQALATVSLRASGEPQAGCDPRLSTAWSELMNQIGSISSCSSTPCGDGSASPDCAPDWFGGAANQYVTALIGRVMGDAYAGFALGFIASEMSNPIIPADGLPNGWFDYPTTYPPSKTSRLGLDFCSYDGSSGMPFWQTPSGSWWGGNMFPANDAGDPTSQYWDPSTCASSIFSKHYNDIATNYCSIWGAYIHLYTEAGYSHPFEDRLKGYNAGINGYMLGPDPVTQLKLTIWQGISATSSLLQSDISGDGTVDGYDLNQLLAEWGSCTPVPGGCQSDFDGNGVVDSKDLAELLASWSAVP